MVFSIGAKQAAMGAISTLPVIVFGYLIQKHLVRGLTFGSLTPGSAAR